MGTMSPPTVTIHHLIHSSMRVPPQRPPFSKLLPPHFTVPSMKVLPGCRSEVFRIFSILLCCLRGSLHSILPFPRTLLCHKMPYIGFPSGRCLLNSLSPQISSPVVYSM